MMRALLCLLVAAASPAVAQPTPDGAVALDVTTSLRPRARSSGAQGDAEPAAAAEDAPAVVEPEAIPAGEDAAVPEPLEELDEDLAGLRPRVRPQGLDTEPLAARVPPVDPGFKAALAAMRDGRWDEAFRRAGPEGSAARDVILWHFLRGGSGSSGDVMAFLRRSGDWPGLAYLREKSEDTMADAPVEDRLAFFDGHEPETGTGALALAQALEASGETGAAQAGIVKAWRTLALSDREQALFLDRYGPLLKPHHEARLDLALWEGWEINATRMLPLVSSGWQRLANARMALRARNVNPDPLIAAVPAALADNPGLAYERYEWRMAKGLRDSAIELLLERSTSPESLGEPEYWAGRRHSLSHRAMRNGDPGLAYRIAATHHTVTGRNFAELEWLSGYLALRFQKDASRALAHFTRFKGDVYTPISLGRAGYWLGRAYEALGNADAAKGAYALGAAYQTSFYGLLAAERGGFPFNSQLGGFRPEADWREAAFTKSGVHEAAMLLLAAGEGWLAERFWTHLAESQDEDNLHLMGKMLEDLGQPHIGIMLGKRAAQDGREIAAPYYAVHPVAQRDHPVPTEMVLAIARRESEFDHTVISHAGARGLMQVMPATAQLVARRVGLDYSQSRLTSDWVYNSRLGADYLRGLAEDFDGNVIMMSAGYNAGPGRPRSWKNAYGDPIKGEIDIIDWIEMIPFNETRNYVMRVSESLPVYRARLGKDPHPVPFSQELVGSTVLPE
ncbi:lytic transglycosylase domain-containing protein [Marinovum sp.]|uniref:lytic transglycosylase domain-containing protein n=1 Tax=Marinovum sp. TaxID=2024839 RepID=UPI002B2743D0|nr:lytic transglycosylase domain-containing protein [Marinovum sp.]